MFVPCEQVSRSWPERRIRDAVRSSQQWRVIQKFKVRGARRLLLADDRCMEGVGDKWSISSTALAADVEFRSVRYRHDGHDASLNRVTDNKIGNIGNAARHI